MSKKKLKKRDAELQEKITEHCQGVKILAAIAAVDGIIKMQPTPPSTDLTLIQDLKKAGEDLRRIETALIRLRIEK